PFNTAVQQITQLQSFTTRRSSDLISILGGNGSGKTTFMKLLAGQEQPYRGNVYVEGKKIHKYKNQELYRQHIAVLPQESQTVFTDRKSTRLNSSHVSNSYADICLK